MTAVRILSAGENATVTFTDASTNLALSVFSDSALTVAVTQPATIGQGLNSDFYFTPSSTSQPVSIVASGANTGLSMVRTFLPNDSMTYQLMTTVAAPLIDRGAWAASHAYAPGDIFTSPYNVRRLVKVPYTSGTTYGSASTGSNTVFLGQAGDAQGTLAGRPAATIEGGAPFSYKATDDNGGKVYDSDGSAWTTNSPGVNEVAAGTDLGFKAITSAFSTSSATVVDVTGLTAMSVTFPASGAILLTLDGEFTSTVANGRVGYQVIDDLSAISLTGAPRSVSANDQNGPPDRIRRLTAAAGTVRVYKVQIDAIGGGSATLGPAILRAVATT